MAEAGFGFTKPDFLGSRLRLPRLLGAWLRLRLRGFQRLRLRFFADEYYKQPGFGFSFVTKALASASKLIRVKASASNFVKASAS